MKRVRELDGLRAIAILGVLGCHYPGFAATPMGLPKFGWIGVDLFFGLSGYLITTILLGLRTSKTPYKTFYSRRSLRILPPYIAATLLIVLLGLAAGKTWVIHPSFLFHQAFFLQAFPKSMRHSLWDLVWHPRWYLFHMPNLLEYAHHLPLGQPGAVGLPSAPGTYWSLSVEEYFYLLWAPVVLRCSRSTVIGIGVAACVVSPLLRWYANDSMASLQIAFRLDALMYGAFLALLFHRWRTTSLPSWATTAFQATFAGSIAGLAGILVAIHPILNREVRSSPLFLSFGLSLISLATVALLGLLIVRAESDWWFARLMRTRPFQSVGTISYTMYLVHIVAASVVMRVAGLLHRGTEALLLQAICSTILTVLVARASWHYFEKPLLRWKDRAFPNAPHPPEPALN